VEDLLARLNADLKVAMRARDAERTGVLRMLLSRIREKQVEGSERTELSPEQIEQVLLSFAKQRREAAEAFAQAGREDLQAKELREHEIVRSYLPEELDDAAIRAVLQEIVTRTGASSPKDLGKVMGVAMQQLRGRADGARVQALVRELLGG
jgi:uncharacterized protein YqeY